MTPAQCRAARGLVELSQAELAAASRVGISTVRNFEAGRSMPVENNLHAIKGALEARGVKFIPENGGGAGVRLAKPSSVSRATPDEMEASTTEVRSQAASAADEAMSDMDATNQEKADRRFALTGEPAMVEKARDKGRLRK